MSGQIPAGWYHDPYGTPGLQRYWDGGQWTQATQPTDEWDDAEFTQSGVAPVGSSPSAGSPAPGGSPPSPGTPQPVGSAPSPGTPQPLGAPPAADPGAAPGAPGPVGFEPPAGAQPNWNWDGPPPGPMTPQPWQSAAGTATPPPWQPPAGTTTPPPWQPPADPAKAQQSAGSSTGLLWALGGGGVVVVVLIVLVALFATGVFDDDPAPVAGPSSTPSPTGPSANSTAQSPVTGTIDDTAAGVSYVQFGGAWQPQSVDPNSVFARNHGFTRGQSAAVQENYDGQGSEYLASVYSGRLPEAVEYGGPDDLESAVTTFARTLETEPAPNGSYPSHTRQDLETDALTISDRPAHFTKFRLDFPQAAANGWNFRSETVVFVLIDQGSGERPSVVWISMPDSHPNGGDLDRLFESIKVP